MKLIQKYFFFLLTVLCCSKAFTQSKDLVYYEKKLIDYHLQIDTRLTKSLALPYDSIGTYNDSVEYFIELLDKTFTGLVTDNPKTLDYPFNRLKDSSLCVVNTSADGNFRIYNFKAWQLSTEVYQWRGNGKVYTKVFRYPKDSSGICGNMFTVTVNGQPHYLPVTSFIIWPKHSKQSVTAWRINGSRLEPVKLFKNKVEEADHIEVPVSFANFFDKKRDSLQYITYNDKDKKFYVPFVNGMEVFTNKYFIYELKGDYLEFASIGEMKKEKGAVAPRR